MNEYFIKYYKNRYQIILWNIMWFLIILSSTTFVFVNKNIQDYYSKYTIIMFLITIIYLIVFLSLGIYLGLKIFSKSFFVKLFEDHIDINIGENTIYFTEINEIKLETMKHAKWGTIVGYIFFIKYKLTKMIKIIIYTGNSKNEIKNSNSLLKFYDDLKIYIDNIDRRKKM